MFVATDADITVIEPPEVIEAEIARDKLQGPARSKVSLKHVQYMRNLAFSSDDPLTMVSGLHTYTRRAVMNVVAHRWSAARMRKFQIT